MNLVNTIVCGFKEIWAHKFRSLLTMLGIILGVSALVAMSALVKGMENGTREALVAVGGLEKIRVEPQFELPVYQRHLTDQMRGLTMDDVYALRDGAPLISNIVPAVEQYRYREPLIATFGSNPQSLSSFPAPGRQLSKSMNTTWRRVACSTNWMAKTRAAFA